MVIDLDKTHQAFIHVNQTLISARSLDRADLKSQSSHSRDPMHETAPPNPGALPPRRHGLGFLRFSAVEMLIVLGLLFVATPFIEGLPNGELIESVLMSLFFLSAVLAVGGRRRSLILTALVAIPAVVGKWMNHLQPQTFPPAIFLVSAMVFLTVIIVQLLRFVLRTPRVNAEVLCASISAYLTLGMLWSLAYRLVSSVNPAAFAISGPQLAHQSMSGFTAFYFSYVTLTTVGYGDITPVSSVARMLAVMESMTGTLYVAILIARLVALYSTPDPSGKSEQNQP